MKPPVCTHKACQARKVFHVHNSRDHTIIQSQRKTTISTTSKESNDCNTMSNDCNTMSKESNDCNKDRKKISESSNESEVNITSEHGEDMSMVNLFKYCLVAVQLLPENSMAGGCELYLDLFD